MSTNDLPPSSLCLCHWQEFTQDVTISSGDATSCYQASNGLQTILQLMINEDEYALSPSENDGLQAAALVLVEVLNLRFEKLHAQNKENTAGTKTVCAEAYLS